MRVFKFGGASVCDAAAVKNVGKVLEKFKNEKLIVVISAMGKTTNALEKVAHAYWKSDEKLRDYIKEVRKFHFKIIDDLGFSTDDDLRGEIENSFVEIDWLIEEPVSKEFGFIYDQIVSHGELMSTKIVSAWLNKSGINNQWLDARDVIQTDNSYREGNINWDLTEKLIQLRIPKMHKISDIILTQGFIGATSENFTTTLGREGSDYSAAIFSFCTNASEMIVWKDVPGVLSSDPRYSTDTIKLEEISYHDAIELTYYGATVLHPKTIKPLENKNIPLRVCSFKSPDERGTTIGNFKSTKPLVPCFIYKPNQILISISAKDFSFIAEENMSKIFKLLASMNIKINVMQNSAISFSICIDNDPYKVSILKGELKKEFRLLYNEDLMLITIRHYFASTLDETVKGKKVFLEQKTRHTAQVVIGKE